MTKKALANKFVLVLEIECKHDASSQKIMEQDVKVVMKKS